MPRISERQETINALETAALLMVQLSYVRMLTSDEDVQLYQNCRTSAVIAAYAEAVTSRYLRARTPVPRLPDRISWLVNELDDGRFRQEARMSKQSFLRVLQLIERHPVFETSHRPQHPVMTQLLVALTNFGTYGNGASVGRIARLYGISG